MGNSPPTQIAANTVAPTTGTNPNTSIPQYTYTIGTDNNSITATPVPSGQAIPAYGSTAGDSGLYSCAPYPDDTGYIICICGSQVSSCTLPNSATEVFCSTTAATNGTYSCTITPPKNTASSNKTLLYIGIGAVVLIILFIIIAVVIYASRGKKSEKKE